MSLINPRRNSYRCNIFVRSRALRECCWILLSCGLLTFVSALACAAEDSQVWTPLEDAEAKEVLRELAAKSARQREGVMTAHVKLKIVRTKTLPVPRDEFLGILNSADLLSNPDRLGDVARRLYAPLLPNQARLADWADVEVWQEGEARVRNDELAGGKRRTDTQDGSNRVLYLESSKQAFVFAAGSHRELSPDMLSDYRYLSPLTPETAAKIGRGNGQLLVSTRGATGYHTDAVFDAASGMVLHRISCDPADVVISECWQQGFVTTAQDLLYPSVYIQARYEKGNLAHVTIALWDTVVFNDTIPEGLFSTVAVPAKTLVADERVTPPVVQKLKVATDDLLDAVDRGVLAEDKTIGQVVPRGPQTSRWMYSSALGAVVIVLAVVLVVRQRRRRTA